MFRRLRQKFSSDYRKLEQPEEASKGSSEAAIFDPVYAEYCRSEIFKNDEGGLTWLELVKVASQNWSLQKVTAQENQSYQYETITPEVTFAEGVGHLQSHDHLSQEQGFETVSGTTKWQHYSSVCQREGIEIGRDGALLFTSSGGYAIGTGIVQGSNYRPARQGFERPVSPKTASFFTAKEYRSALVSFSQAHKGSVADAYREEEALNFSELTKAVSEENGFEARLTLISMLAIMVDLYNPETDESVTGKAPNLQAFFEQYLTEFASEFSVETPKEYKENWAHLFAVTHRIYPEIQFAPEHYASHYAVTQTLKMSEFKKEDLLSFYQSYGAFEGEKSRRSFLKTALEQEDYGFAEKILQQDHYVNLDSLSQKHILSTVMAVPRLLPAFIEQGFDLSTKLDANLASQLSFDFGKKKQATIWAYLVDQNRWDLVHFALSTGQDPVICRDKDDIAMTEVGLLHLAEAKGHYHQYPTLLRSGQFESFPLSQKLAWAEHLFENGQFNILGEILLSEPEIAQQPSKKSLLGFEVLSSSHGRWFVDLIDLAKLDQQQDPKGRDLKDWLKYKNEYASLEVLEELTAKSTQEETLQELISSRSWSLVNHWFEALAEEERPSYAAQLIDQVTGKDLSHFYACADEALVTIVLGCPENLTGDHFIAMAQNGRDAEHIIDYIVGFDLDPSEKDYCGDTLLIEMARQNNKNAAERLIELGSDPKHKNEKGQSFETVARMTGNAALLELIYPAEQVQKMIGLTPRFNQSRQP